MNGHGYATSEVFVVRPKLSKIDTRLSYLFCSEDFRGPAIASMTGAGGLKRISDQSILNYVPKIADISLQKKIADFLDVETSRIGSLIQKKLQVVKTLSEYRDTKVRNILSGLMASDQTRSCSNPWLANVLSTGMSCLRHLVRSLGWQGHSEQGGGGTYPFCAFNDGGRINSFLLMKRQC